MAPPPMAPPVATYVIDSEHFLILVVLLQHKLLPFLRNSSLSLPRLLKVVVVRLQPRSMLVVGLF